MHPFSYTHVIDINWCDVSDTSHLNLTRVTWLDRYIRGADMSVPSFRQNASEASPPPEGRSLREKHTKYTQTDPPPIPSRYRGIKRDTQVSAVDQATGAEDGGSTPCARGCRRSSCGLEVSDIGDVGHARGCGGIRCGLVRGHQPLLHARWACDHRPAGHAAG